MKKELKKQLQTEREKLNELVDAALDGGIPICETYAIMAQSKKVDQLIQKMHTEESCTEEG